MARPKHVHTTKFSQDALTTLLDLIEIKLQSMEVFDREDAREAKILAEARCEIAAILGLVVTPVTPPRQISTAASRMHRT